MAFFATSVSACSSDIEPTEPIGATAELLAGGAGSGPSRPINDEERTSTAAAAAARAADASARRTRGMRRAAAVAAAAAVQPVIVSLTFDDQRVSQSQVRDPLKANGRNFKATFFVASGYVNDRPGEAPGLHPSSLSLAQLRAFVDDGHEIGGHTRNHLDLPTVPAAQQRDEICGGREDLLALGLGARQPIVSFAYPYGDYDTAIEAIVASCGFTSARTVSQGPEFIPPVNAFATATTASGGSIENTDDLATVKSWVTSAGQGRWVQVIFHDIVSARFAAIDKYSQTLADFEAFLDFLQGEQASGRIVVRTVGEVMGGGSAGQCAAAVVTNTYLGRPSYYGTLSLQNAGSVAWTAPTIRFGLSPGSAVCDDANIVPGRDWSLLSSAGQCAYTRVTRLSVPPGGTLSLAYSSNSPSAGVASVPTVTDAACGAASCTPESAATFCARLGKNCGSVTANDNCGTARTVSSCGTCTAPASCGGGGVANVCGSSAAGACSHAVIANSYRGAPDYHGSLTLQNTEARVWTAPRIGFDLPSSGFVCDDAAVLPGAGWSLQSSADRCVYTRTTPALSIAPGATFSLEYSSNDPTTHSTAAVSGISVTGCP